MKRRLLYAASQAYQPRMEVHGREVGWLAPPIAIVRETPHAHRTIDLALVGRVAEGVVIAFRGSLPPFSSGDGWDVLLDWLNDMAAVCVDAPEYGGGVHLGFADSMRRLWEDADGTPGVRSAVAALTAVGAPRTRHHLFVAGHSKGGALANLAAMRLARDPDFRHLRVSVATIGAARVGNAAFVKAYAASRIACLRYELAADLVPQLPPGPRSPAWAHALARTLLPRLATSDYRPVGLHIGGGELLGHQRWTGSRRRLSWLGDRRGRGLEALLPAMLTAHSISPGSAYDRLVCTGEVGCDHGRAEVRRRA